VAAAAGARVVTPVEHLSERSRYRRFFAPTESLGENEPMLHLMEGLGPVVSREVKGGTVEIVGELGRQS
jgi:hypothetical protein